MTKTISIKIDDEEFVARIKNLLSGIKDLSPVMRRISHIMEHEIDENFITEGKNADENWQELSEAYAKEKAKAGKGSLRILEYSGELRQSITRKIGQDYAEVGTNKVYAAIHNFGGDVRKKNGGSFTMPKRTFMKWTPSLKKKVENEVIKYLMEIGK